MLRFASSAVAFLAVLVAIALAATQEVFAHAIGGFAVENPIVRRLLLGALLTGVAILLLYHADGWARERAQSEASRGPAPSRCSSAPENSQASQGDSRPR